MSATPPQAVSYVVFGSGGHAAVVVDALLTAGQSPPLGLLDRDPARHGMLILGAPVLGGDDLLPELIARGVTHFVVGLGSTHDTRLRRKLFELGLSLGLTPLTVRHPSAICSPTAEFGRGVQILAGSIVNTEVKLEDNAVVNTGAVIEHHCVLEAHSHVASNATLAGGVRIGQGAHVGAGATIRQCIRVGNAAVVGAGAVVVKDVAEGVTVVGVPARVLEKSGVMPTIVSAASAVLESGAGLGGLFF